MLVGLVLSSLMMASQSSVDSLMRKADVLVIGNLFVSDGIGYNRHADAASNDFHILYFFCHI